jgi:hypothetical protein
MQSPTGCTDTSQWNRHNCSCGTRVVEKLARYRTRTKTLPTEDPTLYTHLYWRRARFQTIVFYGRNFVSSHIKTLWVSYIYIIICGQTKPYFRPRIILVLSRERGYQFRFSVSLWAGTVRALAPGVPVCYLTGRQWLNATNPGIGMGNRGTISWPPLSSDVNLMDSVLWGHVTEHVYVVPARTIRSSPVITYNSCDNCPSQYVKP